MSNRGIPLAVVSLAAVVEACAPAVPKTFAQDALFRVESDPGVPIPGAVISSGGEVITRTSGTGRAQLRMTGRDGDVFKVLVACPEKFEPASQLDFDLVVRRTVEERVPEFVARCVPSQRRALVAVRTTNGPDLPIVHMGKEIARTDAAGAATVVLDVHPGDDVELVLDTHARPKVHPQNPALAFKASNRDDAVVVLEQVFTIDRAPARRIAAQKPAVPRALGGG